MKTYPNITQPSLEAVHHYLTVLGAAVPPKPIIVNMGSLCSVYGSSDHPPFLSCYRRFMQRIVKPNYLQFWTNLSRQVCFGLFRPVIVFTEVAFARRDSIANVIGRKEILLAFASTFKFTHLVSGIHQASPPSSSSSWVSDANFRSKVMNLRKLSNVSQKRGCLAPRHLVKRQAIFTAGRIF